MTYLEHLKESKLVYYIYRSDFGIFGVTNVPESYFVVVDETYVIPRKFRKNVSESAGTKKLCIDNIEFTLKDREELFKMVLNNDIDI